MLMSDSAIKLPPPLAKEVARIDAMGGLGKVSDEFINFQWTAARLDLHYHISKDFEGQEPDWVLLEDHGLVDDSWKEGMKVLEIVVVIRRRTDHSIDWNVETLRWDFFNGGWKHKKSSILWKFETPILPEVKKLMERH